MKNLSLSLILVCFSSTVWAIAGGTGVSDGGHGVVCRTPSGSTVRFLDAVEGEARSGVDSTGLLRSIELSGDGFYNRFQTVSSVVVIRAAAALGAGHPFVTLLRDEMHRLSAGLPSSFSAPGAIAGFNVTYDYGALDIELKPGCSIVQLAIRTRDHAATKVVVNPQYWSRLPEFDKYQLLVHEAAHAWFAPEVSTKAVREATAYLFSSDGARAAQREAFQALVDSKVAASR